MSTIFRADDVQSLVFSAHARLAFAIARGFAVSEPTRAKHQLRELVDTRVSFGVPARDRTEATQVLLSAAGLRALELPHEAIVGLSREWRQGIAKSHRSRALGDQGRNDPQEWKWKDENVHLFVLHYGLSHTAAEESICKLEHQLAPGWKAVLDLPIRLERREPFGFVDGLSQPRISTGDDRGHVDLIPAGEIVLGCRDATGAVRVVPPLGRSGSYVVVRQLSQDVLAFWRFWNRVARDETEAIWLASKAVGRWPNGLPVTGSNPIRQPPDDDSAIRRSLSFASDPHGDGCPLGSHIRRSNPRDGLDAGQQRSEDIVNLHRIIRRGRVYGSPAPAEWYPELLREEWEGMPEQTNAADERGLLFICLCADLARQFEFIQQTWLNDPKHVHPYNEDDPVAAGDLTGASGNFSIPRAPIRRTLSGSGGWVTVRGGGYFLLLGKTALEMATTMA